LNLNTKKSSLQVSFRPLPYFCLEKRKIIRKLEKVEKLLTESPDQPELIAKKKTYKDHLTYINHYPPLWKYLSLFPKEETPESKAVREETY
jgi:hypothetical protein